MATKKMQFELMGSLVNHPDFPDAKRGDVLKLEVGDDNLPTSDLLRSRVRPLGESLDTGDGMSDKEAKGKAKEIINDAKAEAKGIVDKAKEEAQQILDKANSDAAELLKAAQ